MKENEIRAKIQSNYDSITISNSRIRELEKEIEHFNEMYAEVGNFKRISAKAKTSAGSN